mmetsp:Transcript_50045/g.140313  ORF Transcript_50045/g.140313 Transcript_50045/m.140313 type:complete len:728 (-) Transcript_50045:51-2234(-)
MSLRVMSPSGAERDVQTLAVACDGCRFEISSKDSCFRGFCERVHGSFFQALVDSEAQPLKDETGALVIQELPAAKLKQVWNYLMYNEQPCVECFTEYCEWRQVCDFLSLGVEDPLEAFLESSARGVHGPVAFATHRYLMVARFGFTRFSPICYPLQCADACSLRSSGTYPFDDTCEGGGWRLTYQGGELQFEVAITDTQEVGALRLRFRSETFWQHLGQHVCLRAKRLLALKVRYVGTPPPALVYGDPSSYCLADMFVHASRSGLPRGGDLSVALWPSFWIHVRALWKYTNRHGCRALQAVDFEVTPGAIYPMSGGIIVQIVSQPRSLHKCYMRFCGASVEEEVIVRLTAPSPFLKPDSHAKGGGKVGWKGGGKGKRGWGGIPFKSWFSMFSDPHESRSVQPEPPTDEMARANSAKRCMKQIWVVQRHDASAKTRQVVVLLHALDGRVALAQLSGDTADDCIPRLYPDLHVPRESLVWGRRSKAYSELYSMLGAGCLSSYRGAHNVPRCREVMAVVPEGSGRVAVLYRPGLHKAPQLWTIRSEPVELEGDPWFARPTRCSSFFRLHGQRGGVHAAVGGSWHKERWGAECQHRVKLPSDIIEDIQGQSVRSGGELLPLFVPLTTSNSADVGAAGSDGRVAQSNAEWEVLRISGDVEAVPVRGRRRCAKRHYSNWYPGRGLLTLNGDSAMWQITGCIQYTCRSPMVFQQYRRSAAFASESEQSRTSSDC